ARRARCRPGAASSGRDTRPARPSARLERDRRDRRVEHRLGLRDDIRDRRPHGAPPRRRTALRRGDLPADALWDGLRERRGGACLAFCGGRGGRERALASVQLREGTMSMDSELDELRREVERFRGILPERVDVDPDDVEQGLAKLVLTLVEFVRQLLERQAVRRMEGGTLSDEEVERMGVALMRLEQKVQEMAR